MRSETTGNRMQEGKLSFSEPSRHLCSARLYRFNPLDNFTYCYLLFYYLDCVTDLQRHYVSSPQNHMRSTLRHVWRLKLRRFHPCHCTHLRCPMLSRKTVHSPPLSIFNWGENCFRAVGGFEILGSHSIEKK